MTSPLSTDEAPDNLSILKATQLCLQNSKPVLTTQHPTSKHAHFEVHNPIYFYTRVA